MSLDLLIEAKFIPQVFFYSKYAQNTTILLKKINQY